MKSLGVWAKLGIGVTAIWMIGFSLATYLNLAASVAEERRIGKLVCPSGDANCLAANVSHWIGSSNLSLLAYAIAEATLIAAVFWTAAALGLAMLKSVVDDRQPASRVA